MITSEILRDHTNVHQQLIKTANYLVKQLEELLQVDTKCIQLLSSLSNTIFQFYNIQQLSSEDYVDCEMKMVQYIEEVNSNVREVITNEYRPIVSDLEHLQRQILQQCTSLKSTAEQIKINYQKLEWLDQMTTLLNGRIVNLKNVNDCLLFVITDQNEVTIELLTGDCQLISEFRSQLQHLVQILRHLKN